MMKKIISIFTFVFCLIQSLAQNSIWTEDFEGAWMKAMNEDKLVFVYTYDTEKMSGFAGPFASARELDKFLKSEKFENYAKDNFCCVSIPIRYNNYGSFSVGKYDISKINFQSKKFADVHKEVFETSKISPVGSNIIIYNTGTNKKLVYSPYRSERREQKDDVYMRSIEKMRSDLLGISATVSEGKEGVGDIDDFSAASEYAKKNNQFILILSLYGVAKKFDFAEHELVRKNCKLLYPICETSAYSTIFLCTNDYQKYIPLSISGDFISNLTSAMEKLKNPNYPNYYEKSNIIPKGRTEVFTDFDMALAEAKSKQKLIYICTSSREINDWRKLGDTVTNDIGMVFLNIKKTRFFMRINSSTIRSILLTGDERLAELMSCLGGAKLSGDVIYDPVSRKYCTIQKGTGNLKEKLEIAAAEFKNPYSTKTKFLWPSDEVDEDTEYLTHNFSKALQQAKESNKKLLIIFTSAVKEYISGNIASWALDAKKKYDKAGVICVIIPTYVSSTPTIMPCKYQSLYEKFPEVFKLGKGFFGRLYDPQTGRAVPIQTRSDSVENMLKLIEAGKAELANPDSELAFKVEGLPTNKGVK